MSSKGASEMNDENKEKSALVPRLRFPQFSEAWRANRVGEIAEIFKGKGIAKSDVSNDGIRSCIRYGELYTVYGELVTEVLSRTSLPATELFFGEPNDVIIPSSGETKEDIATAACVIPGGIAFGSDLNVLRTKENGAFLSYYLNGPLRQNIARVAQGDSVVHLYPHQIEKLPIAVPPDRNEQQKIADCLSSLDELITAETQKLDALKTHKMGLMQQLFPREGETVPRLRFPEFREAEEWITKSLKNACEVNPANSELPEQFVYVDLESVEAGQLKARKIVNRDEAPSRAQRLLRFGDVIFQIVRPYQRNNLHFKIEEDIRYVASTGYAQLRANESDDFLFQAVHTDDFVERVIAKCTGSSYPAINSSDLADISLVIPSKAEQQKIADCLSSLDNLITAQSRRVDDLKTHKKGMMQQLFPVLDEVPE